MHLSDEPLLLDTLLAETADPEAGALVIFGGTVRFDGRVTAIDYSAHAPLAERLLRELEAEALQRYPDLRSCRCLHRTGRVVTGELSVLVVVRAGHRPQAFEAASWAIDRLKERLPVWKQEHYADGSSDYLEGTPITSP